MKIEVEIIPEKLGLMRAEKVEEAFKELNDLYQLIWCEACYDPKNEEWRKFAKKLLPHISKVNEILKFKT